MRVFDYGFCGSPTVLNVSWLQGFSQIDFFKQSVIDKVKDSDEH